MATIVETRPSLLEQPVGQALRLTWERVLYAALIVAAFITRFYDLGARVMSHDESLHTQFGWYLWQGRGFQHSPLMHGVLRFEVTALTYWLFGDSDFTARIAPALLGVLAVALMYQFRPWLGRAGALVAAGLMLISPYMLYYTRYIRDEPYVVVWGLLIALCVLRYMETRATRYLYWLAAVTALFYTTMETSYIYVAIAMLFLGIHLVRELLAAPWPHASERLWFGVALIVMIAALVTAGALIVAGRIWGAPAPEPDTATAGALLTRLGAMAGGVAVVAAAAAIAGIVAVLLAFGDAARRSPTVDLLMILGLFVLPQLTAFPVLALGRDPQQYSLPAVAGLPFGQALATIFTSDAGVTLSIWVLLLAVSFAIGLWWDARRFLISAAIFWGIFITLYTTFFTNGWGIATGTIGSLAYWLAQHPVQRGSQPWYFYALVHLPLYEFLPTIGALLAGGLALRDWERRRYAEAAGAEAPRAPRPAWPAEGLPFPAIGYFGFWAVLALVGFSIAGEKMPWLTTHITLPLILLSGWSIGRLIDAVDWPLFRERRAWIVAVLLPVTVLALAALLGSLLGANRPFQGSELAQLQSTGIFISALIVAGICLAALYYLGQRLGFDNVGRLAGLAVLGLLALLTTRAAFIAAYVNYDYANEYLVYAHGARGVRVVMNQIEGLSERLEDGLGLKVAYDSDVAWPMTWYFRDFYNQSYYGEQPTREALNAPVVIAGPKNWSRAEALLGDRYYQFEYIRMVWPMQEYFNLTTERVVYALGDPQYRQALWNIWYRRDYTLFGQLTGGNYQLSEWPVSERMRMYVRKDVAAQIWDYGVGPTVLEGDLTPADPYAEARQVIDAVQTWGGQGSAPGLFQSPRGLAVGPDGSVYVADSRNHRIQKFAPDGSLETTWGSFGSVEAGSGEGGRFNEPWGVAVGPDGSVYVADTWNNRIQKFDSQGQFVTAWGQPGQAESPDAFWGPRSVAVDGQGRVFVADTGNKRVVIFDEDGRGLGVVATGGSDAGQLDEPVGLAVNADGQLYVADTWNLRVQVFEPEPGTDTYHFVREWPVAAWYGESVENKPYIALDPQGRVYLTDPEGYRVIVFDSAGNFVTTWGDFGADTRTFALLSGIAVGPEGSVYVSDPGNQRLMKFAPLP